MTAEVQRAFCAASYLRCAKRATVVLLLFVVICASIWYSRASLLRGAAELWIVSDPVGQADAAVVFGGGLASRPFAAAEYYKEGLVKKILVSNARLDKAEKLGVLPSHTSLNREVLLKLGVPETAIEIFGNGLSNTYQEAVALREWAVSTHARNVIVPTQAFSTRRVRWMVEHELSGTGTHAQVPALDDTEYGLSEWWKDDRAIIEFQNEMIKYAYYRFRY